jgi:hypothetical protein
MRFCSILAICIVMLACGCRQQTSTGFQPSDVCQPEIQYAPDAPWAVGSNVAIGMLIKLEKPSGKSDYIADTMIVPEQATMSARVTFFDGDRVLGESLEVPFVRDC